MDERLPLGAALNVPKAVSGKLFAGAVLAALALGVVAGMVLRDEGKEIPYARYGLPKAYSRPVNVRSYNDQVVAILWPDGHLELKEDADLVVRTMIDQRIALERSARDVSAIAKKQSEEIVKSGLEIEKLKIQLASALQAENELRAELHGKEGAE